MFHLRETKRQNIYLRVIFKVSSMTPALGQGWKPMRGTLPPRAETARAPWEREHPRVFGETPLVGPRHSAHLTNVPRPPRRPSPTPSPSRPRPPLGFSTPVPPLLAGATGLPFSTHPGVFRLFTSKRPRRLFRGLKQLSRMISNRNHLFT